MARSRATEPALAPRAGPHFRLERKHMRLGARYVAGVDEVGRGPLAGPVTVAAVILDPKRVPAGLDDSKALAPARRAELTQAILSSALAISISCASAAEIDRFNIRGATLRAMVRAVAALHPRPDFALIDGCDVPEGIACEAAAVIGGDALCCSIAAASIIAKTTRDALMARADLVCPGYHFARHAGYATQAHRDALELLGPSRLHRASFRGAGLR